MNYSVEKVEQNFDSKILLSIWEDSLPDLDRNRIQWAYEQNPGGQVRLWLLKDLSNQQYIGMCTVFPRRFQFNGKKIECGITADFAVKRRYRSLGPALKLTKAVIASKEFDILFGMPNQKAAGIQLRAGFKELGNASSFLKIFHSRSILRSYSNPLLYSAWPLFDIFFKLKTTRLKFRRESRAEIDNKFDEKIDSLWDNYNRILGFAGKRDSQYLKFRFEKNPYKTYHIFKLPEKDSENLKGYIVYRVKNNIIQIADFFAKDLSDSLTELFESFSAYCMKHKYDAISLLFLDKTKYSKIFRKLGYYQMNSGKKVLFYSHTHEIVEKSEFFLTLGDFDW